MAQTFKQFLTESSLSRIWQHIEDGRSFAVISASRGLLSKAENGKRTKKLASTLTSKGYGYFNVFGNYTELDPETGKEVPVKEVSFFIISKETGKDVKFKKEMEKIGKQFDQDSILYKSGDEETPNLVGTNESGFPGLGKSEKLGKFRPNRISDFMSKMKGKGSFVFESVEIRSPGLNHIALNALKNKFLSD